MENRGTLNLPRQNPWLVRIGVVVFAILVVAVATWEIGSALTAETKTEVPVVVRVAPVVPPVAQPAQQDVAPTIAQVPYPVVTVTWEQIRVEDVPNLPFIPGPEGEKRFNLDVSGEGENGTFLLYEWGDNRASSRPIFTYDDGKSWFELGNPPIERATMDDPTKFCGAVRSGEFIVLCMVVEPEPNKLTYWAARVRIEDLRGLAEK